MEIIKLMALRQIQNSYEKCREVVEQSIKMVTKKQNKSKTRRLRRDIRQLMKIRKNLRKELNQSTDIKERQHLKDNQNNERTYNRQE